MFSLFGQKFRSGETKLADLITRFAGSMAFVYLHIIWFGLWIVFADQVGDSFPYGLLTMVVSLEAIFLATFIMVNQNRQAELAEERERAEEAEQEEIAEDIEDIQEEFDEIHEDLSEVRRLIEKIEAGLSTSQEQTTKPQEK